MNLKSMRSFFYLLLIGVFCPCSLLQGSNGGYMFRLILKDKGNPPYSVEKPGEFLSPEAIGRRARQGLPIDSTDFPIDPAYFSEIRSQGAEIRAFSKWLNTITVYFSDSAEVASVAGLPFVDSVKWVWKGTLGGSLLKTHPEILLSKKSSELHNANIYGPAYTQIHMHEGELLHDAGFRGAGMTIAVLDGGFFHVDQITAFDQSRILGTKNFTHKQSADFYQSDIDHGTKVLSCMLSNDPGRMVGTAPDAGYYLLQTEVPGEEYPVEEDYWISGIEYADSLGVDVVNSSLGYTRFDILFMDHTINELDGKTALISRAASMAAEKKGMLIFNSAGNEGMNNWHKVSFPADAGYIATIGSVNDIRERSSFSSIGLTADGRIKPDLMSMGGNTVLIDGFGMITLGSGTSYAAPVIAGLGACLWQALPGFTSMKVVELLKKNSDRSSVPDSLYGYGIPNVYQAYIQNRPTGIPIAKDCSGVLRLDSRNGLLYVNLPYVDCINSRLYIFSILGNKVLERISLTESVNITGLPKGIYIAYLDVKGKRYVQKFSR